MNAQHTPGPWAYVTGPSIKGRYHTVHAADEYMVCECWDGDDEGQQEADARLIAATPELLEALEEMCAIVARHTYPCPDKPESNWAKLQDARAALAKARGVQP